MANLLTDNTKHYPTPISTKDEISLIDLVTVLVSRKKTLYLMFSIVVLLGIITAFLLPKKHSYTTTIEIGQRIEKGEVKLIDEAETLLAKIRESYIPLALQAYYKANSEDRKIYKIKTSIPKKSHIIVLTAKGTEDEESILKSLSEKVVGNVVLDHGRLINLIKKNHELQIKLIENNILSLEQQAEIYKADLQRVDKNIELIKRQIKSVHAMVNDGIVNRKKASRHIKSESNAMTLLMIDNEIQQNRNKLDRLEEKLIVGMNNKKDVLNKKLSDTFRQILAKRDESALKKLEIENIRDTRALIVGLKSLEPTSLRKKIILLLSIFMGIFVAIIAVFIHEFILKIKAKSLEE